MRASSSRAGSSRRAWRRMSQGATSIWRDRVRPAAVMAMIQTRRSSALCSRVTRSAATMRSMMPVTVELVAAMRRDSSDSDRLPTASSSLRTLSWVAVMPWRAELSRARRRDSACR